MSVARRCDECLELVDAPSLKWSLSLPARGKERPARFFDLCSDECLRDFAVDGIAAAALRREERERERVAAEGQSMPLPSPFDMPPASTERARA